MAAASSQTQEDGIPIGICPMCGRNIEEIQRAGFWDGYESFGSWYSGRCVECDVDFKLDVERLIPGAWRIHAPDAGFLKSILTEPEIVELSVRLSRYKIRGAKWQSFLVRRRPGDEVWCFTCDDDQAGIAVVRNGRPIAQFFNRIN